MVGRAGLRGARGLAGTTTWPVHAGKAAVTASGGEHGVDVVAAASSEIVGLLLQGNTVLGVEPA